MAGETASAHLRYTLELRGEKVYKPKSTVLFRRGDKASGMLSFSAEKVSLDLGVDSSLGRCCGAACFGGSAFNDHSAKLQHDRYGDRGCSTRFWTLEALESLLRRHTDLCQPLLVILGATVAENHDAERRFVDEERAD